MAKKSSLFLFELNWKMSFLVSATSANPLQSSKHSLNRALGWAHRCPVRQWHQQPVPHFSYHWDTFSFVCSTNNPSSPFARGGISPLHNNLFGHEDSENASGVPSFVLFFFTFFCFNIQAFSWLTWCVPVPRKMKSSSSAQMETTCIKNKPPGSWRCPLGVQIKSSWTLYEESL